MAEHGPLAARFASFAPKLFGWNPDGFGEVFAEGAVWHSTAGTLNGRREILAGLAQLKQHLGWIGWEMVSSAESSGVLSFLGRSDLADGRHLFLAAAAQCNDAGEVVTLMSVRTQPE